MDTYGWLIDTRTSYDTVADSYADHVREALDGKPYIHAALALFTELVRALGGGPVADVGCGPGHVTAHLHDSGLDAFGVDLSPAMIEAARRDHPGLRFEVGSMTDLPLADASVAGLVAFWSVVHVPDDALPGVLGHFRRALRPGGPLLLGFRVGDTSRLKTEGYGGHPMKVHVHRRQPADMAALLRDAGFAVEAQLLLDPDAEDLVAQTMEIARRRIGDVPETEPLPWLYAVAHNLWRNTTRRERRRRELLARFRMDPADDGQDPGGLEPALLRAALA